jgi:hypothetical protein
MSHEWLKRLSLVRGSGVCRQPVPPGMPVVGAQVAADGSRWQFPGKSPPPSRRATPPTKKSGEGRRSDCPRNRFTRHTLMSSVGALDSRRANAQESGCLIGSPNVASTIVSAHSSAARDGSCFGAGGHRTFEMGYAHTDNYATTMRALCQVVKSRDARF